MHIIAVMQCSVLYHPVAIIIAMRYDLQLLGIALVLGGDKKYGSSQKFLIPFYKHTTPRRKVDNLQTSAPSLR